MARIVVICLMIFFALGCPSFALKVGNDNGSSRQQGSLMLKGAKSARATLMRVQNAIGAAVSKANSAATAASASDDDIMPLGFLEDSESYRLSRDEVGEGDANTEAAVGASFLGFRAEEDEQPVGGIMYYQYSMGKYCDVNDKYIYKGMDSNCQRRCVQTVGCNYYTTYMNGFCQLSTNCNKQGVADDPDSRTFAQVNKEPTFSQYSVGTSCTSDGGFLHTSSDMDCEQQCKITPGCSYYTIHDSGYCQLSRTCTTTVVEEGDSSAVTYQSPTAVGPDTAVPKAGSKMCSKGKLLPNLYLLGVQKAGTTSLAGDLVEAGVWNTRQADAIDAPTTSSKADNDESAVSDAASYDALVSAAGIMVGDLMSAGVMTPQDLSKRTKQAIADDLVAAGVLSSQTVDNLDDDTKKSLASDLVKAGVLHTMKASKMDPKTQTLLTRDLVQACFLNASITQSLDPESKQELARDVVHASITAGVFASVSSEKLHNRTKQMLAVDFLKAGALRTELADHINVATKKALFQDALQHNLNLAASMSNDTKQFVADDLINAQILNGDMIAYLANNTKKSLAADLLTAGGLETVPFASLQPNTKEWLTFDINRIRTQKGWNIIMGSEMNGDTLIQNLKGLDPEQLSDQTKVFLVDDLANSANLFSESEDLSFATKQMLVQDLIQAGRMGSSAVHFTMNTKLRLANDLIHSDLIDADTMNQLSDETKQMLTDDFISAGALKGSGHFMPTNLNPSTNESLAGDLLQAGLIYESLAPATDMYLAMDVVKAGLLTNEIADKLSTNTKQSLVKKLQSNGLLSDDLAQHLDPSAKANFLAINGKTDGLQDNTKFSITNDLLASGLMKHAATLWSARTRELIVKDVMKAGLTKYTKPYTTGSMDVTNKESHFFEHAVLGYDYSQTMREGATDWAAARHAWKNLWLDRLVDCPEGDAKPVYADFTPANMRMVPLPDGTQAKGRQWGILGDAMFDANPTLPSDLVMDLPQAMNDFYGQKKHKITFVVMLREPLARMQSAYYHTKNSPGSGPCSECKGSSFSRAMNVTLMYALGQAPENEGPFYRDWLWTSMYARQLEHWFQYFHPSQFYVIPTFIYSKGSNIQICKDLSARVKTDIDCTPFKKTIAQQMNTHEHPPVEQDSTIGLRMHFYDIMNPENERLVKVLAEANNVGLSLATYDGAKGDQADIKKWLVHNW